MEEEDSSATPEAEPTAYGLGGSVFWDMTGDSQGKATGRGRHWGGSWPRQSWISICMGREEMTEKGSFRVSTSGWQDDSKAQGQGTLVEREGNACVQASFTTSQPPGGCLRPHTTMVTLSLIWNMNLKSPKGQWILNPFEGNFGAWCRRESFLSRLCTWTSRPL